MFIIVESIFQAIESKVKLLVTPPNSITERVNSERIMSAKLGEILVRENLVTPQQLRKQRRMAILVIAVLAALLPVAGAPWARWAWPALVLGVMLLV